MDTDVIVVGAGPAGMSVAACLRGRGIDTLVLDRGTAAGDSWRSRYERLHLHTPRVQSALPGLRIPGGSGRWVPKDDMADYVARYARHHGIAPRFGTEVRRIERDGAGLGRARRQRALDRAAGRGRDGLQQLAGRPALAGAGGLRRRDPARVGLPSPDGVCRAECARRRRRQLGRRDRCGPRRGRSGARVARRPHAAQHRPAPARPRADHADVDRDGVLPRVAGRPGEPPHAARGARRPDPLRHAGGSHGRRRPGARDRRPPRRSTSAS